MKIPVKLSICPIEEAVIEIRFQSEHPNEAIFGIIYSEIKEYFSDKKVVSLPIQNIPEQIRDQDPSLKYQATQRLQEGNLTFSIGPRTLVFGHHKQYAGWSKWSEFISKILSKLLKIDLINKMERIGLRYINLFDGNLLKDTNFQLLINDKKILDDTTNLRVQLSDGDILKIVQIGNAVPVVTSNISKIASIVDIDCIYDFKMNDQPKDFEKILSRMHDKEKELFFQLLKEDFIKKLGPEY